MNQNKITSDHNQGVKIALVGDTSDNGLDKITLDPEIRDILQDVDILIWNCEGPILPDKMRILFYIRKFVIDLIASFFGNKQPRVISTQQIADTMRIAKIWNFEIKHDGTWSLNYNS